ncbi:sigma-E processing peptidase SpoIIGA [Oceanobacillus massiliensis]|uniref:sigma-E processing peptidase SpoIIGA n=1 Tax=Oceanobacillus massiliensis TaxID=1465765 RepID=UPI000287B2BC|nr:sigma-E processing peptidase SpoIIGA [Oceanobacillus massiliensis]
MTIYLDAVWALNFLLDLMLLMLTKALARDQSGILKLLFGAFIASLIVPITLYFPDSFINGFAGKILYSVFIVFCAFGFKGYYRLMKLLLLFYFTSFAIGGGLTGVYFLLANPVTTTENGILTFNKGYGDPVSWLFIIIGFPIVWYFTKKRMDEHAGDKIRYDQLCEVNVQIKNAAFSTMGYIDSGNQLLDPLTKRPVVICDELFLKNWFSNEEWDQLKEANDNLALEQIPEDWEHKIQVIPYQGVEGNSNFLLAIRPDEVMVDYENQKLLTSNVLIGIQFGTLVKDSSYHCLLHPQIIKLATIQSA